MQWPGRWTWASVLLLLVGQGCFDPNENELPTTETEGATTSGSGSVTVTDASATDSSPTDASASDSATDDSVDTSASTDPTTDTTVTSTDDTSGDEVSSSTGEVAGPCDTFDPMCPVGFKCTIWANDGTDEWNEMFCMPLDPDPVGVGEACVVQGGPATGIDNCDAGLVCFEVDVDTSQGTCSAFCTGSAADPMCDAASTCVQFNSDLINLCVAFCDPLLQDCEMGDACYPFDESFICAPDASGAQGAFGEECMFINACDPGLLCANPIVVPGCEGVMVGGCCTPFCDLTDPNASANCPGAAGGQQCVAWYEEGQAPMGLEDVGVCAIPV